MPRATAFREGFSGGLGRGMDLGRQVKQNRADKRDKAIDTEIGDILEETPEVTRQAIEMPRDKVGPPAAMAGEAGDPSASPDETGMPMGMRYATDGEAAINRVKKLMYERHGGYTPEYVQSMQAYRGELQNEQQQLMNQAEQAMQAGDKGAAAEALTRAYSMFPNGKGIDIKEDADGNLYGVGFDTDTLEFDGAIPIDAKSIGMARRQMADPNRFDAFMFDTKKDRRAQAEEGRKSEETTYMKSRRETREEAEELQLKMSRLDAAIAEEPDIGKRATMRLDREAAKADIKKAMASAFEADAKALYYLEGGSNAGKPRFPGGLNANEYKALVTDVRENVEGRVDGSMTMSDPRYNLLYDEHSRLVYSLANVALQAALVDGKVYDPANIIDTAEKKAIEILDRRGEFAGMEDAAIEENAAL